MIELYSLVKSRTYIRPWLNQVEKTITLQCIYFF